jgi:hypothetical protein
VFVGVVIYIKTAPLPEGRNAVDFHIYFFNIFDFKIPVCSPIGKSKKLA